MVDRCCVHSYLPDAIRRDGVVFDLGANRGDFARAMVDRFDCTVHAMEPVPAFHRTLRDIPGVQVHPYCLAPSGGEVVLHVPEDGDATLYPEERSILSKISVPGMTLQQFFEQQANREVDLVKLDVEGAELPVLEETPSTVLLQMRQITVEFHDWQHPETSERVANVKRRLRRIGFYCICFSGNNGDVLFVRRDQMNWVQYLYLAFLVRNLRGARRLLGRHVGRVLGNTDA